MEDLFLVHTRDEEFILEPPMYCSPSQCLSISVSRTVQKNSVHPSTNDLKEVRLASKSVRAKVIFNPIDRADLRQDVCVRSVECYAILGIVHLLRGPYLVVAVDTSVIGEIEYGCVVRRINKIELLPIPINSQKSNDGQGYKGLSAQDLQDEQMYLEMIHRVVNDKALYFAGLYDLTNSCQRISRLRIKEAGHRSPLNKKTSERLNYDERFCWNHHMLTEFKANGYSAFIQPIISGFVQICKNLTVSKTRFKYIFISRRGRGRQGTRFNVRGVDEKGCAANFVETEQIIMPASDIANIKVCSFVQLRGSIPIPWSQPATLKYMPRVLLDNNPKERQKRFVKHFINESGLDVYRKITIVNLIDKYGKSTTVLDQKSLGEAFSDQVDAFNDERLRFIWFDFHKECRKMKWHNLSKLLDQVKEYLKEYKYFAASNDSETLLEQTGVIRTNCMDNLDRTNVVQSLFARVALLAQIRLIEEGSVGEDFAIPLESKFADFENTFKNVWANNADALSVLYSGTPALKTDFTRTGKRTKVGALKDGINSVTRYYLNNFCDGKRQDSFDLFLGNFDPTQHKPPQAKKNKKSILHILKRIAITYVEILIIISVCSAISLTEDLDFNTRIKLAAYFTVALLIILTQRMLAKGFDPSITQEYVSRPVFIPL